MYEAVLWIFLSALSWAVIWLLVDRERLHKEAVIQRDKNAYFFDQIKLLIEEVSEQKQIIELATLDCVKLDTIDENHISNN